MLNKKILAVLLQWDYGIKERGVSGEKIWFYDTLNQLVSDVEPFWYDGYLNNLPLLQQALLQKADEYQPDLIFFVPYRNEFDHETLIRLKNKYKTYAWFGDDHWRFESYSSQYHKHYRYISTTDPWSVSKYRKMGASPILTEWAGLANTAISEDSLLQTNYKFNVSFIGGYNEVRGWFIKNLEKKGVHVEVFGNGWPHGKVSNDQMKDIFRLSKINLNLSNSITNDIRFILGGPKNFARWLISKKNSEQVKARNFEIPLNGGFQLSNYALGLERHWIIGNEIAVFTTIEECAKQIDYYQNNEEERYQMLKRSFIKANREHTYYSRLKNILEEIWRQE